MLKFSFVLAFALAISGLASTQEDANQIAVADTSGSIVDPVLADDNRLVRSVSLDDLEAIIVSKGHTVEATKTISDYSARGRDDDGTKYLMIGTACNDATQRCLGVNMQVRYTYDETQDWEALARANMKRAAASTWRSGDTIGITRYVILDGGMNMENIKVNLDNLLAIAPDAFAFATGENPDAPEDVAAE